MGGAGDMFYTHTDIYISVELSNIHKAGHLFYYGCSCIYIPSADIIIIYNVHKDASDTFEKWLLNRINDVV